MLIPEKFKMVLNKAKSKIDEVTGNILIHQYANNSLLQSFFCYI